MYENYNLRPKAESTNTPAGGQWYYPTTSAQSTLDFFFWRVWFVVVQEHVLLNWLLLIAKPLK